MKRILALFLSAFAVCSLLLPLESSALEDPELTNGVSAVLIHNESGKILYRTGEEQNIEAGPAARLLAALVYLTSFEDLEEQVAVNRAVTGLATSTMNPGLKSGEHISVYDLLCGMLIANSEDAVYALAYALYDNSANSVNNMLAEMNRTAKSLGMKDSNFVSITGRDPATTAEDGIPAPVNTTSLSDLILLADAARKNETLTAICALDQYTVPATDRSEKRLLYTRNYLLSPLRVPGYTYENATGLVAENSARAGYCVIATASYPDKSFTAIVMGATEQYGSFTDAKALFKWADSGFSYRRVLGPTDIFGEIHVALSGESDYIAVAPEKTVYSFLPKDADLSKCLSYKEKLSFTRLTAPVYEGLIAGRVEVFFEGEPLVEADLVTTGSLPLNNRYYYLALTRNFLTSKQFLYICIAVVLLFLCYLLINARVRYLRKNNPDALDFVEEENAPPSARRTPPKKEKPKPEQEKPELKQEKTEQMSADPEQPSLSPPGGENDGQEGAGQKNAGQESAGQESEEFGVDDNYLKMPGDEPKKKEEERDDTGGFAIPTPKRTLYDAETGRELVIEEEKKKPDPDEYVPSGWND